MFPPVLIDVSTAVICFLSSCYPALVGADTPRGEFTFRHYSTSTPGYGGDILAFHERGDEVFAVHRVLDVPGQQRATRLLIPHAQYRQEVTGGCVNVSPETYEKLVSCCHGSAVTVR